MTELSKEEFVKLGVNAGMNTDRVEMLYDRSNNLTSERKNKYINFINKKRMNIDLKNDFEIIEDGVHYRIPEYKVVDGKGIEKTGNYMDIKFVRGSKLKDENVEKKEGTLHEHILAVLIHDLNFKHKLVPSREGAITLTKLQEAIQWLWQRQVDRIMKGIIGTYKK